MKFNNISGAEAVTQALMLEGVDTVFGYPGGSNLPIYDSFFDHKDQLTHVLVRHEQGAVHAAEGYAEVTGKCGVCMVTSGPGATNLLTGIADAMQDSIPVVCITGQVATPNLGYDAFQETDVVGFSMPVTKWNYQITKAEEIASVISKAFFIASSGRPGPVLIDITKDAQNQILEEFDYQKCNQIRSYHPKLKPIQEDVEKAAELINNAQKPLMILGHGVIISKAEEQAMQLAKKLDIPVCCTLKGLSAYPTDDENYIGMTGLHGNYAPNKMTNQCDVLIAIGMRFADRVTSNPKTYAKQAKIIHIEIDPSEINKVVKCDIGIIADAKSALNALLPLTQEKKHTKWIELAKQYLEHEQSKVYARDFSKEGDMLKMPMVVKKISDYVNNDAVTITDVGQNQMMSARYFGYKKTLSNVTSGGLGTMGYALPASVGVSFAIKNRPIITIMGDGGFQMTMQELGVIMQYKLPIKMVVLNNNFLGMIRQLQDLYYGSRYYFGQMENPDFVMIAQSYGIPAQRIDKLSLLDKAIKDMMETPGAYFLECLVEKTDNVYPVIPSGKAVDQIKLEE